MIQICASLTERSVVETIDRMADLTGRADMFEIRGDLLAELDLLTILRARTEPLLFTCRSPAHGGKWRHDEERRRNTLLEAVKRGFDYVDVELDSGFMEVVAEKAGRGLVVSHHDLGGVPGDLDGIYERMCSMGADVAKIAVTPASVAEVGRLLAFADRVARRGGTPLVAIAMGPLGVVTRLVGGRYGAPFTFASAASGAETAPGQLPVDAMVELYRVRQVSRETKLYGVLGSSVQGSVSPLLHNTAFEAEGLDAIYVPLQAEDLDAFLRALPALEVSGFSVTRPYKEAILPHLAEVEDAASECGSVNTVMVGEGGALRGATTDGVGVLAPLRKHVDVYETQVVIVGAGGAARAAAHTLAGRGAKVTLLARDAERAAVVADAVGCEWGDLGEIERYSWDVLINATPLGSGSLVHETPVPAICHRAGSVVLDMVYDPLETILLQEARGAAATVINGLEMLVAQAAPQFERWTGRVAPTGAMEEAAARLVQDREG